MCRAGPRYTSDHILLVDPHPPYTTKSVSTRCPAVLEAICHKAIVSIKAKICKWITGNKHLNVAAGGLPLTDVWYLMPLFTGEDRHSALTFDTTGVSVCPSLVRHLLRRFSFNPCPGIIHSFDSSCLQLARCSLSYVGTRVFSRVLSGGPQV